MIRQKRRRLSFEKCKRKKKKEKENDKSIRTEMNVFRFGESGSVNELSI